MGKKRNRERERNAYWIFTYLEKLNELNVIIIDPKSVLLFGLLTCYLTMRKPDTSSPHTITHATSPGSLTLWKKRPKPKGPKPKGPMRSGWLRDDTHTHSGSDVLCDQGVKLAHETSSGPIIHFN